MLIFDNQIICTKNMGPGPPGALAEKVKLEDIYTYIEQWGKDYKEIGPGTRWLVLESWLAYKRDVIKFHKIR